MALHLVRKRNLRFLVPFRSGRDAVIHLGGVDNGFIGHGLFLSGSGWRGGAAKGLRRAMGWSHAGISGKADVKLERVLRTCRRTRGDEPG